MAESEKAHSASQFLKKKLIYSSSKLWFKPSPLKREFNSSLIKTKQRVSNTSNALAIAIFSMASSVILFGTLIATSWLGIFTNRAASPDSTYYNRGRINLYNNCPFPIYIEGVSNVTYLDTTIYLGKSISHLFRLTINGIGNSIKIATQKGGSNITQVEYSACFPNYRNVACWPPNTIFYDLSDINGDPLVEYGIRIEPSFENCTTISCPPGVQQCDLVYYHPNNNYAVRSCDSYADLNVNICLTGTPTIEQDKAKDSPEH